MRGRRGSVPSVRGRCRSTRMSAKDGSISPRRPPGRLGRELSWYEGRETGLVPVALLFLFRRQDRPAGYRTSRIAIGDSLLENPRFSTSFLRGRNLVLSSRPLLRFESWHKVLLRLRILGMIENLNRPQGR